MEVAPADVSKNGMIRSGETSGFVAGLIEKPQLEDAPSRLASIGRYVLEHEILAQTPPGVGGEIQLADAINARAGQGRANAVPLSGTGYDHAATLHRKTSKAEL